MERRSGLEQLQSKWTSSSASTIQKWRQFVVTHRFIQAAIGTKWPILLYAMAFLLGKAMILEVLSPFALAYFAAIYVLRKDLIGWIGVFLFMGSLLASESQPGLLTVQLLIFLLLLKALESYGRFEISLVPLAALLSNFSVNLFSGAVSGMFDWYLIVMITVEALLCFVLTMIFLQALPIFILQRKSYILKNEEIICLIILLASVMTGTVGWIIYGVSIEHIFSRYLILLFAFVGGAALGASAGVVSGLILSLANANAIYQMSLLAFAGLLAGMLKEGGRITVALGMLLGSSILTVYMGNQAEVMVSSWETAAAILLFFITPKRTVQAFARFIPGTQEHLKTQHDYAIRVRQVTAGRVEQFSRVFRQLSGTFRQTTPDTDEKKKQEWGHFVEAISNQSCAACWKRTQCWDKHYVQTNRWMSDMMSAIEANPEMERKDIKGQWKQWCVKTDKVLDIMKSQFVGYKHNQQRKKQIQESRMLVADQLSGVSQVMEDLANEIKREGHELHLQEEQIRQALEELGLSIHAIDIISLNPGKVEIEIIHRYSKGFDECRKIIAPLLSNILGENIAVKQEEGVEKGKGYHMVMFGSAKGYEIDTGIACAAKGGELLSGDSYSTVELSNGKYAVAISDGMGNGERALTESSAALTILQQLLESGMEERLAIKSLNSLLLLRSSDEVFATVDLALIDLYSANTIFMKIGSTPSFIKRGAEVIPVMANNLPVGIIKDLDVDLVGMKLQPGDILIMMTDGIYDAPGHAVNKELWMKRVIREIECEEPQAFADCLLETMVRHQSGEIFDDMTIIVARVNRYKPEWASFRWPGLSHMERPRTVS